MEPSPEPIVEEWPAVDRRTDERRTEAERREGDRRASEVPPEPTDGGAPAVFEDETQDLDAPASDRGSNPTDLYVNWDELSQFVASDAGAAGMAVQADESIGDAWWDDTSGTEPEPLNPHDPNPHGPNPHGHGGWNETAEPVQSGGSAWSQQGDDDWSLPPLDDEYADYEQNPYGPPTGAVDAIGHDGGLDSDYGENDYEDDYYAPVRNQQQARFASHVDLDEPDDFESQYEWSFDDDDDLVVEDREPGYRTSRNASPQQRKRSKKPEPATDLAGFLRARNKVLIILAVLATIVVLSALGSGSFERLGAAPASNGGPTTCETEKRSWTDRPAELQDKLAQPSAWTARPDYEASTGVIDFARALQLEPNGAEALGVLDRTRLIGGYDRSYVNEPADSTLNITIYQFAGATCAEDYARIRSESMQVSNRFDIDGIHPAYGWALDNDKVVVAASRGNLAMLVTLTHLPSVDQGTLHQARADVTSIAQSQWALLDT